MKRPEARDGRANSEGEAGAMQSRSKSAQAKRKGRSGGRGRLLRRYRRTRFMEEPAPSGDSLAPAGLQEAGHPAHPPESSPMLLRHSRRTGIAVRTRPPDRFVECLGRLVDLAVAGGSFVLAVGGVVPPGARHRSAVESPRPGPDRPARAGGNAVRRVQPSPDRLTPTHASAPCPAPHPTDSA